MGVFDASLGTLLIGVVLSAVLYGVTCIQTWYYYNGYPSDPWYIKYLVATIFVLDTSHQAMISHTAYTYMVTDFATPEALGNLTWSLIGEATITGCTAFLVQSFLAMRIYTLSNKSLLMPGLVMILVIGDFILLLIYTGKSFRFRTFVELATILTPSMVVDAVAAAADILITVFLCYLLQGSRTGFRRSNAMINRLMVFSINTGLLTSLCAIAALVTLGTWPDTFIYTVFYFSLGRLYCNSLLATLNARRAIKGESDTNEMSLTIPLASVCDNAPMVFKLPDQMSRAEASSKQTIQCLSESTPPQPDKQHW